jgi:hypothetical protein
MYAALKNEGLDVKKLDPTNSYVRFGSASKLQFDFFSGWGSIKKAGVVFGGICPVAGIEESSCPRTFFW